MAIDVPIAVFLPLLIQALPALIGDAIALAALLEGSAAAVRVAAAGNGTVPLGTLRALGLPAERVDVGSMGL